MRPSDKAIAAGILDLAHRRGVGKTFCPSDVARGFGENWRELMPEVRRVAGGLAETGRIAVTQKGRPVDAEVAKGPIRLGLPDAR